MATVADQDSLQSAVKLVQITREAIKYLEAAQKVTDVLNRMVQTEAKEKRVSEQYFLNGYPDEDKNVVWDARFMLGLYEQELESLKNKLAQAEGQVGRLQVLREETREGVWDA